MTIPVHIPIGLRLMSLICRICPCCVIARRWPKSAFARQYRKIQHRCPFCRAYGQVKQILIRAEQEQAKRVAVRRAGD